VNRASGFLGTTSLHRKICPTIYQIAGFAASKIVETLTLTSKRETDFRRLDCIASHKLAYALNEESPFPARSAFV
jgi:hypothetical protein